MAGGAVRHSLLRLKSGLVGLALGLAVAAPVLAEDMQRLSGAYRGIGRAQDMAITLRVEGERIYGRMIDGRENVFEISGFVAPDHGHGSLHGAVGNARFRAEPRSSGLNFTLVPVTPDGQENQPAARLYSFARAKVKAQALLDFEKAAARNSSMAVDLLAFAQSYEGHSSRQTTEAYKLMGFADQSFLNSFAFLQADIMHRLCAADAEASVLSLAMTGQSLSCQELEDLFAQLDRDGALADFKSELAHQLSAAADLLACQQGAAKQCATEIEAATLQALQWQTAELALHIGDEEKGLNSKAWAQRQAARLAAKAKQAAQVAQDVIGTRLGETAETVAFMPKPKPAFALSAARQSAIDRLPEPRKRPLQELDMTSDATVDELILASLDQSMLMEKPDAVLADGETAQINPAIALRGSISNAQPAAGKSAWPADSALTAGQLSRILRRMRERPAPEQAS